MRAIDTLDTRVWEYEPFARSIDICREEVIVAALFWKNVYRMSMGPMPQRNRLNSTPRGSGDETTTGHSTPGIEAVSQLLSVATENLAEM